MSKSQKLKEKLGTKIFDEKVGYIGEKLNMDRNGVILMLDNVDNFKSLKGMSTNARRGFCRYLNKIDIVIGYIKKEIKAEFFAEYHLIIKKNVGVRDYLN